MTTDYSIKAAAASFCNCFLLFLIWLSTYQDVKALPTTTYDSDQSLPPTQLFQPIQISPVALPRYPQEPLSPMYPSFPTTYEPVLTGKCPANFSALSAVIDKTSSDCSASLARFVGDVICCPQLSSLIHIFLGHYATNTSQLVLQNAVATHCFKDIISILASRGANATIPHLCSLKSSNLTGGTCPVKDATLFEKMVNTTDLLDACRSVDPLKECCRPVCQRAISEAALRISQGESTSIESNVVKDPVAVATSIALNDCKRVVYSWISRKLSPDAANIAFRILSSCKVNKVCPLEFRQPSEVIKACRDLAAPKPSCCSSLNTYIMGIQKQMLISNRQAIICATSFGSMLQRGGVMTDIYELCDVDLKDFSLQAYGQQDVGCLLRSWPSDVEMDNTTGFSFTCDLSDNVAAPWPSSSSLSSLSLCAPEMSLPALPTSETSTNPGHRCSRFKFLVPIFSFFIFSIL